MRGEDLEPAGARVATVGHPLAAIRSVLSCHVVARDKIMPAVAPLCISRLAFNGGVGVGECTPRQ